LEAGILNFYFEGSPNAAVADFQVAAASGRPFGHVRNRFAYAGRDVVQFLVGESEAAREIDDGSPGGCN
jgi:hypothetical protein